MLINHPRGSKSIEKSPKWSCLHEHQSYRIEQSKRHYQALGDFANPKYRSSIFRLSFKELCLLAAVGTWNLTVGNELETGSCAASKYFKCCKNRNKLGWVHPSNWFPYVEYLKVVQFILFWAYKCCSSHQVWDTEDCAVLCGEQSAHKLVISQLSGNDICICNTKQLYKWNLACT